MTVITVKRLTGDASSLLNAAADEWRSAPEEKLALQPTPLISQPSLYVQAKWKDVPYGVTQEMNVKAGHNGEAVFFHLTWRDENQDSAIDDTDHFTDAAAVLFPLLDDAPLLSMGSPDQPVNAWLWRPDLENPFSVTAKGVGTTVRSQDVSLAGQAAYADGAWSVVVSRGFTSDSKDSVALQAGKQGKVAFAVWQGSNGERGGLKAVTLEWQPMEIEA